MRRALIRTLVAASLFLAAASVGYFVSSSLSQDLLRAEAERQLTRLMRGPVEIDRVRLLLRLGLRIEGENVRIYPSEGRPGLEARRVDAEIDVLALLLGDFHLAWLRIQDATFRVERNAQGAWSPYPVATLFDGDAESDRGLDVHLDLLHGIESVARYLVEEERIAAKVEIENGSVSWVDWGPRGSREAPIHLWLESLYGSWDHRWLSRDPELRLRGVLVDAERRRNRFEAEGHRREDALLSLSLAINHFPLDVFVPYLEDSVPGSKLRGQLSGVLTYQTPEEQHGLLELDWVGRGIAVDVPRQSGSMRLEAAEVGAKGSLEIQPSRVRLTALDLSGPGASFHATAHLGRPIRESSRARLSMSLSNLDRKLADRAFLGLPAEDRKTLKPLFDSVSGGRIVQIGGRGTARIAEWRRLFTGDLSVLPTGVVFSAELRDLEVASGGSERLTNLGGVVEWSGDRVALHSATGLWNGEPLPELNVEIEGLSHLFAGPPASRTLRPGSKPLPGFEPLVQVLRDLGDDDESAQREMLPPLHVRVDALDHPLLRWPLRDARVRLEEHKSGLQISILSGSWAGAPIHGELTIYESDPPRVRAFLEAGSTGSLPGLEPDPMLDHDGSVETQRVAGEWGHGHFRVGAVRRGALSFDDLHGDFRLAGDRVQIADVRAELAGGGSLEGSAEFELDEPEDVGLNLSLQIRKGDVARLSGLLGLPPDFATGSLELVAALDGYVEPERHPLAGLRGSVKLDAKNGELRQRLPLIVAIAKATEGFNPFSARKAVTYERIETVLNLDEGIVSSEEFRLEGPMRVFASGEMNLRKEHENIDAVMGVFLFRQADRVLGKIPLVNLIISDKGLVGAYFSLEGPIAKPTIRALPTKTLVEQMPSVVTAPFRLLRMLVPTRSKAKGSDAEKSAESPEP